MAVAPQPRVRRTQAERVAESDRRMLDAATSLIATHGYAATTFEAIGAEAGYSRQLVAQRFGSKDRLLEAVISRHIDVLRRLAAEGRASLTGLAALYNEIDTYLHALNAPSVESRAFFVLMLESAGPVPQLRPTFASFSVQWEAMLLQDIRDGQGRGSLRPDVDARTEARLLIATLRGILIQSMIDPQASDVPAALNTLKVALAERLLSRSVPQNHPQPAARHT
jgi:AcrR family transcriptional regulator